MTKHDDQKPKQKGHRPAHHHKKVFDVVPPGKAPASPNSRSVIVGHKPQVHDDQFVLSEHWASDPKEKKPLMDGHKKVKLMPSGEDRGPQHQAEEASPKDEAVKDSAAKLVVNTVPAKEPPESTPVASEATPEKSESKPVEAPPEHGNEKIDPKDPSLIALEHLMVEQVVEEPGPGSETVPVSEGKNPADASPRVAVGTEVKPADAAQSDTQLNPPSAAADFWDSPKNQDSPAPQTAPHGASDDLLAQTDAPILEPQKAVVSQHHPHASVWEMILTFLLVLLVGIVALNFLLDANIINTELQVPHTDLIGG